MMVMHWVKTQLLYRKKEATLVASEEVGLDVDTEKIKYVYVSWTECRKKIQHKEINPVKTWQIKYLGMPLTNGSCMHEEIKSRLNSGKLCYHLAQNLLSSHLLPKSTTTILSFVLYECEIWPFTIREESWLRAFEKWVLRKIFWFKRKYTGCFKKSFTTLKAYRNLYRGHTQRFELSKCSKTHRVLPQIVIRNCYTIPFMHVVL